VTLAGAAYLNQGRYTDAEDALQRARSLHAASNRHDDVFTAQVLN
jgi:cytochrome c-type biogenesis protein CcmH/NrfG